jgi:hypothetical protein
MFSSPSYAKWTKVDESVFGDTYYVDFERIKKVGEYVYFWELGDLGKPTTTGILPAKVCKQADCNLFRIKNLNYFDYKKPMGSGTSITFLPPEVWRSAPPNSAIERSLKKVFSRVMFSPPPHSKWTLVGKLNDGSTYYIDFETIRKQGRYVYWWDLDSHLKQTGNEILSVKKHLQGDYQLLRIKDLTYIASRQPMGRGDDKIWTPKNPEWNHPDSGSPAATSLKEVCGHMLGETLMD